MTEKGLEYSLWSKDLVFVISDGYLEGMQAFITSYHGAEQSSWFLHYKNKPIVGPILIFLS